MPAVPSSSSAYAYQNNATLQQAQTLVMHRDQLTTSGMHGSHSTGMHGGHHSSTGMMHRRISLSQTTYSSDPHHSVIAPPTDFVPATGGYGEPLRQAATADDGSLDYAFTTSYASWKTADVLPYLGYGDGDDERNGSCSDSEGLLNDSEDTAGGLHDCDLYGMDWIGAEASLNTRADTAAGLYL
jgi:hypothetical protein